MIFTDEDLELANMIGDWLKKEAMPVCAEYDEKDEFPQELYDGMVELGLNNMATPEEYGGLGLSAMQQTLIAEQMGMYEAGLGSAVGVNASSSHLMNMFGTDEQKKIFFDILVNGGWAGFCLTEPGAGSDAGGIKTKAVPEGDEYVINGSKCFITNGAIAGVYCVFAKTDKDAGHRGISCFLVERSREGISTGSQEKKMGIRLSNTTTVNFDDVHVPKDHLIGELNKGFKIAMKTLDESRLNVAAMGVGLAQRVLDESIAYAKERKQFGKPIAAIGAIQTKIADIAIDVESTRQLVYHAAELIDADGPFELYSCMAKCRGADIAVRSAIEGIQIFGGYGYSKEYPMEKLLRDSKIFQIYEGTCEVQRQIVAGMLLR